MIEIQGRTTVSVEQYAVVLRKMELEPFVKVKLNRGIMKRSSSISFTELDGTKREYFFDDPYLDYRLTIHLDNNEFKATFLHLLDEYTHELSDSLRGLTKQRLRAFYTHIKNLDTILSEFKRQTKLASYPKNIVVILADYLERESTDGTKEHWVGEYHPKDEKVLPYLERYDVKIGAQDIILYATKSTLEGEGIFIHELIHHLMNVEGLGRTEDERKMLDVAKKYLPASWITKRFERHVKSRLS